MKIALLLAIGVLLVRPRRIRDLITFVQFVEIPFLGGKIVGRLMI